MEITSNEVVLSKVILVAVDVSDPYFAESLEELRELTATAGAEILDVIVQHRTGIDKNIVIGKGKLEEIAALVIEKNADLVIFNNELAPSQVKNIEAVLKCNVIDRTVLILDIFAQRAKTKEGKLQVECAQLKYLMPRLVGIRSNLSKLGGGIGTRGPGESKLETDKRYIKERIKRLEDDIEEISKTRNTLRQKRVKENRKIVSIVGYTNSGKSTLLNALTNSDVYAENKLFATLDPTSRLLKLKNDEVLLIDTVGFIRDLPHGIIKAFKSTLEEAINADLILNVCDITNPQQDLQNKTTAKTLEEIGANAKQIMVYNKIDKLPTCQNLVSNDDTVFISAKLKVGFEDLAKAINNFFSQSKVSLAVKIPYTNMSAISKMHSNCEIVKETQADGYSIFDIKIDNDSSILQFMQEFEIV